MTRPGKARIIEFQLFATDLPFRRKFKHAAAERMQSESIFLKCTTDAGVSGWGESLPRPYVTRESRQSAFTLLRDQILPHLIGMQFASLDEVWTFLRECDGKAPAGWLAPATPQTAAWSAVDLALLDGFGRAFCQPLRLATAGGPPRALRYSAVLSAGEGFDYLRSLIKVRLFGFRDVKLKLGNSSSVQGARWARWILGARCDIRADANMVWSEEEALAAIRVLSAFRIRWIEQPIDATNHTGLARLVRDSGSEVMVDESMTGRDSLEALIAQRACTGVNVRISKCGGLTAAFARCRQSLAAGLTVQIGCQVGESSLLSAAHLILTSSIPEVRYVEGCFGLHLLREDPGRPYLQFGNGGRPPAPPDGPGLGVELDLNTLEHWSVERAVVR